MLVSAATGERSRDNINVNSYQTGPGTLVFDIKMFNLIVIVVKIVFVCSGKQPTDRNSRLEVEHVQTAPNVANYALSPFPLSHKWSIFYELAFLAASPPHTLPGCD